MPEKPKKLSRKTIQNTGIFHLEEIDLQFSNGARRKYQRIVSTPQGAVLIIPMLDPETLLLIREYAAGMDRYELAFPKGHIEQGEDALTAANREIQEEVGYAANKLQHLTSMTVAPGYLYHTTHIVVAEELFLNRLEGDEPEPIEVVPWKLSQISSLMEQNDFTEARSIAALYMLREYIDRRK
ncbi:MAG: ADP compounds hydrolase NudE [Gammaproteobacteria bacterium]|nr:ADP compounds hydrolase NudE [Gammaproteobacteria bacterium]